MDAVVWDEYFSYWVKGERLCDWADEWLKSGIKLRRSLKLSKTHAKLVALFHLLPEEWTNKQLLTLIPD